MADESGFKHITLIPPESEDEVIYAGFFEEESEQTVVCGNERTAGTDAREIPGCESGEAQEDGIEDSSSALGEVNGTGESSDAQSDDRTRSSAEIRSKMSGHKDDFRETTLKDLEDVKMPLTQKIVIIAAIMLIIVAVVYYFMVLR